MVSLIYVAQQYTVYMGSLIFILGIFGNFMVISIFSMERSYRTNPCTFYFLTATVHDMLLVAVILGIRIATLFFGIDLTQKSVAWCKIRYYLFATWAGITVTCQCLAAIDQFLITSRSTRLRHLSTLKGAYRAVAVTIIIWWLHGIPWLIYQDISPTSGACVYINPIFLQYVIFFGLVTICLLPMTVIGIFGFLAYRNISSTMALNQQNAHRQTTIMVCTQAFMIVGCGIFNGGWNVYVWITYLMAKDIERLSKEYLFQSVIALLTYVVFSVSVATHIKNM